MVARSSLEEALLAAPAGAVTLAALEAGALRAGDLGCIEALGEAETEQAALDAAVRDVTAAGFEDLIEVGVFAAMRLAGPYWSESPRNLARALRAAPGRRRLAEAIVGRFGDQLAGAADRRSQEWWWLYNIDHWDDVPPLGEHTGAHWAWLTAPANWFFTINPVPTSLRGVLGVAWDESSDDLTRWTVAVAPGARIYEIHRPEDWTTLVLDHPDDSRSAPGWEINPGWDDTHLGLDDLAAVPGQRACRSGVRRFLEPNWASVATRWDAVHLSWAGFFTTEGTVSDLGNDDATMLRGWGSERTVWLNPVLSNPRPIHPTATDQPSSRWSDDTIRTVDLRGDHARFERELAFLERRLGIGRSGA